MTERLKEAQEAKRRVFSLPEGQQSLRMSLSEAAVAFGIPKDRFLEMARKGETLLIQVEGDNAKISLVVGKAGELQKKMWEEMISAFRRTRGEVYLTKKSYLALYRRIQVGLPKELEDDIGLFHLALYALWDRLPGATQLALASTNPGNVRLAVGIVRSSE